MVKAILMMLIKLAGIVLAWLPEHTPIAWPDVGWLASTVGVFRVVSGFAHWPVLVTVLGVILVIEGAALFYILWRTILGLIPGLK